MFDASVNGELYDPERWAKFYKPYGFDYVGNSSGAAPKAPAPAPKAPAPAPVANEADDVDDTPVAAPASTSGKSANDILEMIRRRSQA
jgi:hypothetical protein